MKKKIITAAFFTLIPLLGLILYLFRQPDVTVIGPIKVGDGLGRNTADFIEILSKKNFVNCLPTYLSKKDLNPLVKNVINHPNKKMGKVILFTKPIWTPSEKNSKILKKISKAKNSIKIAYSMFESSRIPAEWAMNLNQYFDVVVVPDEYLVNVYKKSGVIIPIKVLPLCLDLSNLSKKPLKKQKNDLFTFSVLSSGLYRKNIIQVVKAFSRAFANDENVLLRINSRYSLDQTNNTIKDFIKNHKISNILFTEVSLSKEIYELLLSNSDCLINVSMGEGFSIQPREAMALGIPCIISNNTAQKTICNTNLVASLDCSQIEPAKHFFSDHYYGEFFKSNEDDLVEKMLDVYENYQSYINDSPKMREWAMQYDIKQLQEDYENFFEISNLKETVDLY